MALKDLNVEVRNIFSAKHYTLNDTEIVLVIKIS